MKPCAYLCLVLHNHQPVGNFDGVFEQSYQDSYLPFLEVFEPFADLKISLHTSGPLLLWLAERHPEYVTRLRRLIDAGRIEILGGPMYEPILTMLPRRDRLGQITAFTHWIQNRLGAKVRGMWTPERVWEPSLASDMVDAGMEYTVLDDYHFRAAGWSNELLTGPFITEDDGRILRIFPGSERLRYLIPFAPVQQTMEFLREAAQRSPGIQLVFGDDGEKFGTWPDTKEHVYQQGWLRGFFEQLSQQRDWLHTTTLAEVSDQCPTVGKIFLPACSYREMTEWALPAERQAEFETVMHELEHAPDGERLQRMMRGGLWRNFQVKYTEAEEMYARMMHVSRRVAEAADTYGFDAVAEARDQLFRGQCNCPYWHGAFGGIYLPHLRNAIYHHLIKSEVALDRVCRGNQTIWVEAEASDFNFDGKNEVHLCTDQIAAWFSPFHGGHLYELDARGIGHNLLATMRRRPEAYHQKVRSGPSVAGAECASIHDRVVFKQAGLDQSLQYDSRHRKSLIDYFFDAGVTLDGMRNQTAPQRGDFADLPFEAYLHRNQEKIQLRMQRDGNVWGYPVTITKGVTMVRGGSELEILYVLDHLPSDRDLEFAIEFNFAGMPGNAEGRYFHDGSGTQLGGLHSVLDLSSRNEFSLVDRWLGLEVGLFADQPTGWWAYPVATVSQSEGGFELVHQSVCVLPHWHVRPDVRGRWSVRLRMEITVDPGAPSGLYLFGRQRLEVPTLFPEVASGATLQTK